MSSSPGREGEPHRVRTAGVVCSLCRRTVELTQPLPREGWHVVHRCSGGAIEALAMRAGERPWAWRRTDAKT